MTPAGTAVWSVRQTRGVRRVDCRHARTAARRRAAIRDHRSLLIVSPKPVPRHQRSIARLYRILEDNCPDDHKVSLTPLDWHGPPHVLAARSARRREGPNRREDHHHTPNSCRRMLSPSSSRYDRMLKSARYRGRRPAVLDRRPAVGGHPAADSQGSLLGPRVLPAGGRARGWPGKSASPNRSLVVDRYHRPDEELASLVIRMREFGAHLPGLGHSGAVTAA